VASNGDGRDPGSYRVARQRYAGLLIGVVGAIVLGDLVLDSYHVEPAVLVPLLLAAMGLLAVDAPWMRRP
jgi:uncharacterized membrane protein YccC